MAQRLATEYVNATMQMTDVQMDRFLQGTHALRVSSRVKVMDGGEHEFVLEDESGEEVHLPFERKNGLYVCELSCRLVTPHLADAVRKLFTAFKGSGKVNRIYRGFTMSYDYHVGTVHRITQMTGNESIVIYEYKNTAGELQRLFNSKEAEKEIESIQQNINFLLDQRIAAGNDMLKIQSIDEQLRSYNQRLFVLEA
ncbi:non-ribosomal peptide synthetase module [Paenibacillus ihbetae]|uniref:Non-ribosomal peptide synthetase module n=1 Tax=Paenibacillus ihbetae TaxID=1870820 RepID=A0ABX3JNB4_9BACL|nr:non-ribosomal peptide synthetase module [Paenibacillus ihbetae]OOC58319.1 non-ribosomal peptide synthetase module [Paenibacillus ihbetae]